MSRLSQSKCKGSKRDWQLLSSTLTSSSHKNAKIVAAMKKSECINMNLFILSGAAAAAVWQGKSQIEIGSRRELAIGTHTGVLLSCDKVGEVTNNKETGNNTCQRPTQCLLATWEPWLLQPSQIGDKLKLLRGLGKDQITWCFSYGALGFYSPLKRILHAPPPGR